MLKFVHASTDRLVKRLHYFTGLLQLADNFEQTCQFHQVETNLLKSGLLQLVICRFVATC